jgi:WD40 repeat protein
MTGHTGEVNDAEFSPQGDQIASACDDETVRLWCVESGGCQRVLTGHSRGVWVVKYSSQGNQVASAGEDGTVRLWDVQTGVCQHTLIGHSLGIEKIAYSPNGNQIAYASKDTTVRLWDVKTGSCSNIFIGHQWGATQVVYSPRGDQVASASCYDKTVRVWDMESGECRHTLVGHEKDIYAIAYSPRGNLIASWSNGGEARLWDVETGDCCWKFSYETTPQSDSFLLHDFAWISSEPPSFTTGDHNGSVRVWDVVGEGDECHVRMRWRSTNGQLGLEDACVQDVQGLSYLNRRLLKQRGAKGEPKMRLSETGKKVMSMASVVSKLKSSSTDIEASS